MSALTHEQAEDLLRAAETLRDNARTSFGAALDATNPDAASVLCDAADTYARQANAVCAAMRALGIRGVTPDFSADDFERMRRARGER